MQAGKGFLSDLSQDAWAERWRVKETATIGTGWGEAITEDRARELKTRQRTWLLTHRIAPNPAIGPFEGYTLTGADVFWLAVQRVRRQKGMTDDAASHWLREASVNWWKCRPTPTLENFTFGLPPRNAVRSPAWLRMPSVDEGPLKEVSEALDNLRLARDQWFNDQCAMDFNLAGSMLVGNFTGAYLWRADLREATLSGAKLTGAVLDQCDLEDAKASHADLSTVSAYEANLTRLLASKADFSDAFLVDIKAEKARFNQARLDRARLNNCQMARAELTFASLHAAQLPSGQLNDANLYGAHFEAADCRLADFSDAKIRSAFFNGAYLGGARLRGAELHDTWLVGADLQGADMRGVKIGRSQHEAAAVFTAGELKDECRKELKDVPGALARTEATIADLRYARFNEATELAGVLIGSSGSSATLFSGAHWGGVPLNGAIPGRLLGEEALLDPQFGIAWKTFHAIQPGTEGASSQETDAIREAVRANREFAAELRNRGFTSSADRFGYRQQICMQRARRQSGATSAWFGWLIIGLLTGYGYKVWRILAAYGISILAFSVGYAFSGSHLKWWQAVVLAITAFHGRGVAPPATLSGVAEALVAIEAIVGLVIEAMFVGIFLQRLINR